MKRLIIILFTVLSLTVNAQIGYQVSLLNKATGEPRANETVTVEVKITDSKDKVIYSGTQSATTNDFGVLSLSVGNADTFNNVDWNNLPLYVSATVDNVLLGRSQILSVPVAEHAKHTGTLTKEILMRKTWAGKGSNGQDFSIKFSEQKMTLVEYYVSSNSTYTGVYYIVGNSVIIPELNEPGYYAIPLILVYLPQKNMLLDAGRMHVTYK